MTQYSGKIIRKNPVVPTQRSASGVWTLGDAASATKNNTWPVAGVPAPISRSVRLRSSASAYFNRSAYPVASAGTQWTMSMWVKRGTIGTQTDLFTFVSTTGSAQQAGIQFDSNNAIRWWQYAPSSYQFQKITTAVFRDPSAWYHLVFVYDTTLSTAEDRCQVWINGVRQTSFSTNTNPSQNLVTYYKTGGLYPYIGAENRNASSALTTFDGYLTEINFIDGQALTPSSFGTTDSITGAWIPMPYTGTYGTNGFYLNFKDNTSTTTLGLDYSGNSNHWTPNAISLATSTAIQTFSSTGTTSWTAPAGVTSVSYLVVGGGGAGANGAGVGAGGGGGGGMLTGTLAVTPGASYTVTVGAGGVGSTSTTGANGQNSVFSSITAIGGGGGSGSGSGSAGGSGGGGSYNGSGGAATSGQGNAGGSGSGTPYYSAGGGGGAGGAGANGTNSTVGSGGGGAGLASSISGSSVTYAMGAGGGGVAGSGAASGSSPAGAGTAVTTGTAGSGTANRGGGGGGSGNGTGGSGGSGVVILSWTTAGSATYDSMVDTPTSWMAYNTDGDVGATVRGNYCTLNPLQPASTTVVVPTDGNLKMTGTASGNNVTGTMAIVGSTYFEGTVITGGGTLQFGVKNLDTGNTYAYDSSGNKSLAGTSTAYGATFTTNDIIGVAVDPVNLTLQFYKNNTSQGVISSAFPAGNYVPFFYASNTNASAANFGQRPFAYIPPAGFKTLNTFNLPDSTIKNGAQYMAASTYTGNGATQSISNAVNGVSFQPDLVWVKSRSNAYHGALVDSVRGVDKYLYSSLTVAEETQTTALSSFNSNGFSLNGSFGNVNANAATYVGWQWKESASAGFDIVTCTTNGSGIITSTSHALGVTPSMILLKARTGTDAWYVYHKNSTATATQGTLNLNTTSAVNTTNGSSGGVDKWTVSSSAFAAGNAAWTYQANTNHIAYLFAEVAGYSKFGSYTGNGSADGTFVYLGFRPKFVMVKDTSSTSAGAYWFIWDSSRNTYNLTDNELAANSSVAENVADGNAVIDLLSNGFKFRANTYGNVSGATNIYAAFAELPFKNSNAR